MSSLNQPVNLGHFQPIGHERIVQHEPILRVPTGYRYAEIQRVDRLVEPTFLKDTDHETRTFRLP